MIRASLALIATRAAVCVALATSAASASAVTCYTLIDRNDNTVYRDTIPPVDLTDPGPAPREALRQRGEYLIIADTDRCPQVAFVFGQNGSPNLSTDEFLNGIRPTGRTPSGVPASAVTRTGSAPAAAPRSAPAAK